MTTSVTHDEGVETDSDHVLAQMLQLEFDREHDRQLMAEEKHYNKQTKGNVYQHNFLFQLAIIYLYSKNII